MAERAKNVEKLEPERPTRAKMSARESLERMRKFGERREKFIAAIREGKD